MPQLTQKEKQLLKDQTTHEKVCIDKYRQNAQQADDPQLKQLFQSYAQQEQQHLNTLNSILSGQTPSTGQGQQSQTATSATGQQSTTSQTGQPAQAGTVGQQAGAQAQGATAATASQADAMMCNDMLMTEKYVSGAYDTAIFEFSDASVRQALNHIQKEEQQHGEGIFNYLSSKGMYNTQ